MDAADAQDGQHTPELDGERRRGAAHAAVDARRRAGGRDPRGLRRRAVVDVAHVRGVIRLGAIALFLALALNPLVDAVGRRLRLPRVLLILMVYVLRCSARSW